MNTKHLLEIRARLKSKKPKFLAQGANKRKELSARWRRPHGVRSKIRVGLSGKRKKPSQGYRSPKQVRGFHKTGLILIRVCSLKDLDMLPKQACITISSVVGKKKKIEIVRKAERMNISVTNIKPEEFLKQFEKEKREKLEEKERTEKGAEGKKPAVKTEKKKEEVKKEQTKKEKEEAAEEDRKEAEKKERDKLLTKRIR